MFKTWKNYSAFTLAEVLVTLGIIGVVAAMTMPSLISNHKKNVYVTQLKKSVSTLEQGFKKMLADDAVEYLFYTTTFSSIGSGDCYAAYSTDSDGCKDFYANLKKYFKIVDIQKASDVGYKKKFIKAGSTPDYPVSDNKGVSNLMFLADGSIITNYLFYNTPSPTLSCAAIKALGGRMCYSVGKVSIDVNGKKGPNIEGRDYFNFHITEYGNLVPAWGLEDSIYYRGNTQTWQDLPDKCGTKGKADAEKVSLYGAGCAARIIDNGWIMDY